MLNGKNAARRNGVVVAGEPAACEGLEGRVMMAVDLVAGAPRIRMPGVYSAGQEFQAIIGYVNAGVTASGVFHTEGFLSKDRTWGNADDRALGELDFADEGLGPVTASGTGALPRIPGNTPAGMYYLGVRVDSRGEVGESNEGNNIAFSADRLVVQGSPPEIEISGNMRVIGDGDTTPRTLDGTAYGSVATSSGVEHTFKIRNTGTGPLFLYGQTPVKITGANVSDFEIVRQPRATIKAGTSATFVVRFSPLGEGLRKATIKILNNDGSEGEYDFRVRGTGFRAPEVAVLRDLTFAVVSNTVVELGTFGVGQETLFTFTVSNEGGSVLHIGTPVLVNGGAGGMASMKFVVVDQPGSLSLAAGASTTFTIRLDTLEVGEFSAQVSFSTDDGDENPFGFGVRGVVV